MSGTRSREAIIVYLCVKTGKCSVDVCWLRSGGFEVLMKSFFHRVRLYRRALLFDMTDLLND